jgi:hypothetical protein
VTARAHVETSIPSFYFEARTEPERRSNSWEQPMTDPAIDAIREARHQISHEFGNDAARLSDHYRRMQETFAGRIIHGPEADAAQQSVEPDGSAPSPSAGSRSAG